MQLLKLINFTVPAAIKFHSHGDMTIPRLWMKADVACDNWFVQHVLYYCVSIRVGSKNLMEENKELRTFQGFDSSHHRNEIRLTFKHAAWPAFEPGR